MGCYALIPSTRHHQWARSCRGLPQATIAPLMAKTMSNLRTTLCSNYVIFLLYSCRHTYTCVGRTHDHDIHVDTSEDNVDELVLYHMGPSDQTPVVRFTSNLTFKFDFYQLSHLTSIGAINC